MVDLNIKLPESFFQEEERDGYLVSAKTKEFWAVELDLLNEFDRVCKEHNLKYILDFGTLLGAIRHKGFIPWDIDIDVSMVRDDFDKLLEIGPHEFRHPYFFQNQRTEIAFDMDVTRLRRTDTTAMNINDVLYGNSYNQGIFLDIDVFDYVPTNDRAVVEKYHRKCKKHSKAMYAISHRPTFGGWNRPTALKMLHYIAYKLRYSNLQNASQRLDQDSMQFDRSDYVCCLHSNIDTWCRDRKVYEDIIEVPFENLMLPVPAAFDEVLTQCYGDYMTPVIDRRKIMIYVDTNRSYLDVIQEKGYCERICKENFINPKDYEMGLFDFIKYKLRIE